MAHGPAAQIGQILAGAEALLLKHRPDRVLILGDTNSGMTAIIARRLGIPVYHMEAGNRCFDDRVPEEVNRRVIDHCSTVLLPYTHNSRENLLREGIPSASVFVTGNPIRQVLDYYADKIDASAVLDTVGVQEKRFFLVTAHRAENVDDEVRLRSIMTALSQLTAAHGFPVVYSVHPRTQSRLDRFGLVNDNPGLKLLEPLGLVDFVRLEKSAFCILSDSGTVQEEACLLGVPNVTIRDVTERPETVECGSNVLSGCAADQISRSVDLAVETGGRWDPPAEYLAHQRCGNGLPDRHELSGPGPCGARVAGALARGGEVMRILLLSQWFYPEPIFKGLPFAQALRNLGHEVEVVTGFPNYPGGRVYPGYRVRPYATEVVDGIRIHRLPLYPSHDRSGLRRAANYLSFAASATAGVMLARRPDVAYVYHPPATIAIPAMALNLLKGVPYVLDIQDLWPDTVAASGMAGHPRLLSMLNGLCSAAYRRASRIVVLSPGFKAALTARGVAADKIDVIPNWCDEAALLNRDAVAPARDDDRFEVVFAGTMGAAQGLDTVLAAAEILRTSAPHVRFTFVGGGIDVDRLQGLASARALTNVRFVPQQPIEKISTFLSAADALLVHLKDDPLFRITIPSKTQAYMAIGKPIIMGVAGDAAALVNDARCGVTCVPGVAESLAAAVQQLAALSVQERHQIGQNGARFYQQQLSMAVGVGRFDAVLRRAAATA